MREHYEIQLAYIQDHETCSFIQQNSSWQAIAMPSWDPNIRYFICHARHAEIALHFLNLGEVQILHKNKWHDVEFSDVWYPQTPFMDPNAKLIVKKPFNPNQTNLAKPWFTSTCYFETADIIDILNFAVQEGALPSEGVMIEEGMEKTLNKKALSVKYESYHRPSDFEYFGVNARGETLFSSTITDFTTIVLSAMIYPRNELLELL